MADPDKTVEKVQEKIEQPVKGWRQRVIQARAIVPSSWRRYRAAIFEGYLVVAVIIFAVLAFLAHTIAYFTFDLVITEQIQQFHGIFFDTVMRFLTWLGFSPQAPMIVLFMILFLYISGLKWESVVLLLGNTSVRSPRKHRNLRQDNPFKRGIGCLND